jgi:hypothetical protein
MSGTRNGQEWPARGSIVELPDDEARTLINGEMAIPVADPEQVQRATLPARDVEVRSSKK